MAITIEMPRLSDSMHEGTVLRWIKKTGDFVEVGDHLADIETDKAHVELQACEDGTLTEIRVGPPDAYLPEPEAPGARKKKKARVQEDPF